MCNLAVVLTFHLKYLIQQWFHSCMLIVEHISFYFRVWFLVISPVFVSFVPQSSSSAVYWISMRTVVNPAPKCWEVCRSLCTNYRPVFLYTSYSSLAIYCLKSLLYKFRLTSGLFYHSLCHQCSQEYSST